MRYLRVHNMTPAFCATVMILAAGRGERMKPLTDTTPKPLLKIKGKALIEYHLEKLVRAGVKEVVINVAWLGHLIKKQLGDGSALGLKIHYCDEGGQALETAGGIVNALPYLDAQFWVINADIYTDFELSNITLNDSLACLIMVDNPDFHPNGDFGIKDSYLLERAEKQFTFSGIGYYKQDFFKGLTQGKRPLAPLIRNHAKDKKIKAILHQGFWSDIGTLERLNALKT